MFHGKISDSKYITSDVRWIEGGIGGKHFYEVIVLNSHGFNLAFVVKCTYIY